MAHQPMHANHWIEIDKEYKWYIDQKARIIREQGKRAARLISLYNRLARFICQVTTMTLTTR